MCIWTTAAARPACSRPGREAKVVCHPSRTAASGRSGPAVGRVAAGPGRQGRGLRRAAAGAARRAGRRGVRGAARPRSHPHAGPRAPPRGVPRRRRPVPGRGGRHVLDLGQGPGTDEYYLRPATPPRFQPGGGAGLAGPAAGSGSAAADGCASPTTAGSTAAMRGAADRGRATRSTCGWTACRQDVWPHAGGSRTPSRAPRTSCWMPSPLWRGRRTPISPAERPCRRISASGSGISPARSLRGMLGYLAAVDDPDD